MQATSQFMVFIFSFSQVPTIEYHNVTWTWLDFLLAVKSRFKDSLVSQAIKKKLSMRSSNNSGHATSGKGDSKGKRPLAAQDDEEKAKLLFGAIMFPNSKKK